MIIPIDEEQLKLYWEQMKGLLRYCKMASSGEVLPDEFYERKISDLYDYLEKGKAYLLADVEEELVRGFLWACVLPKETGARFHVLYLVVGAEHQREGIGKKLMDVAEQRAKELGISQMELNVHAGNNRAEVFYHKRGYEAERITLVKQLGKR